MPRVWAFFRVRAGLRGLGRAFLYLAIYPVGCRRCIRVANLFSVLSSCGGYPAGLSYKLRVTLVYRPAEADD